MPSNYKLAASAERLLLHVVRRLSARTSEGLIVSPLQQRKNRLHLFSLSDQLVS